MTSCLVDTGSSASVVPRSFLPAECFDNGFALRGVDGNAISISGRLELPAQIGQWAVGHSLLVAEIATGRLLGVVFPLKHAVSVNKRRKQLFVPGGTSLELHSSAVQINHCFSESNRYRGRSNHEQVS